MNIYSEFLIKLFKNISKQVIYVTEDMLTSNRVRIKKIILFREKIRYQCPMLCAEHEEDCGVSINKCLNLNDLKGL